MNKKFFRLRLLIAIAVWFVTWAIFAYLLPDQAKHNSLALALVSVSSLFGGLAVAVLAFTLTDTDDGDKDKFLSG